MFFFADINECKYNKGGCSHECVNDDGGHHCACPDPLVLSDDNQTCRGEERQKINLKLFINFPLKCQNV